MKKKLNRNLKKKIYFKIKKKILCEDQTIFCKKNKIHRIIKFLPFDFKLLKKGTDKITHFNIKNTNSKPGKYYYIVQILKPGFFDGAVNIEPVLNSKKIFFVRCLSVKNNIDYNKIHKTIFKHSLSKIKNIKMLKKAIKRRYKKTLAHLSDNEKMSLGVGISQFQIIKKNISIESVYNNNKNILNLKKSFI